jgi:DNA-directed RNA polymerase subunit M/transcription elongation factor TFIIS
MIEECVRISMKKLEIEDVYSPVGLCSNCGCELLLESRRDSSENFEVKCWACGYSKEVDLDFLEKYVKKLNSDIQTWRIHRTSQECPNGLIVFGNNLFVTTDEKNSIFNKIYDNEITTEEEQSLKAHLESIEGREEAIDFYYRTNEIEKAYHYAAHDHECLIGGKSSLQKCREMVNLISHNPSALFIEHWNIYGIVLKSWKTCCAIASVGNYAQNETEMRFLFLEKLHSIAKEYEYEVWFGQDREIYVKRKKLKPDAQIPALVVIEIKAFFDKQQYSRSQAAQRVALDLKKLEKYKGKFKVGFFLCFSQKFSKEDLISKSQLLFPYPVRVLVCGKEAI